MSEKSPSEQLRREAQELLITAHLLVDKAAQLLDKSIALETKVGNRVSAELVSIGRPMPRIRVIPLKDVRVPKAPGLKTDGNSANKITKPGSQ